MCVCGGEGRSGTGVDGSKGRTKTRPEKPGPNLEGGSLKLAGTALSLPRFPSEHFGKLFGLVMALSAIVSLLQFPIFMLIKGPLQNDPLYVSTVPRGGEGSSSKDIQTGATPWGPSRGHPQTWPCPDYYTAC